MNTPLASKLANLREFLLDAPVNVIADFDECVRDAKALEPTPFFHGLIVTLIDGNTDAEIFSVEIDKHRDASGRLNADELFRQIKHYVSAQDAVAVEVAS
jgi:hypothetical protein